MTIHQNSTFTYKTYVDTALQTSGVHLSIGRGGFILHYGNGARLSGYDPDPIKAECIAAGLPVIDSRRVPFETAVDLVFTGPMIAVGREPDPQPWHALSFATLKAVASAFAAAGGEIWNMPGLGHGTRRPMRGAKA